MLSSRALAARGAILRRHVRTSQLVRAASTSLFAGKDVFEGRHIGPRPADIQDMVKTLNFETLDEVMDKTIPAAIRTGYELDGVPSPASETEAMAELKRIAQKNKQFKSYIGMGYYGTKTPQVIKRNMLENPGWYTAYTPYQAEVSQGRLEMLLNFQTMVSDLCSLPIANCSLLDEGSSAAEALNMCHGLLRGKRSKFFVADDCHPQTIGCVVTRAKGLNVEVVQGPASDLTNPEKINLDEFSGVLVQYPNTYGTVSDFSELADTLHEHGSRLVVASDLLAMTTLRPPGDFGADICVGTSQRFGVPMWFGGPHAGFMAAKQEFQRLIPGRLIGVSIDSQGNRALRMALQTREQFIKREKATSNICTAQALLANVSAAYGIYHGPEGLREIADTVHGITCVVADVAKTLGYKRAFGSEDDMFFDTLTLSPPEGTTVDEIIARGLENEVNFRVVQGRTDAFGVSIDETTTRDDVVKLVSILAGKPAEELVDASLAKTDTEFPRHSNMNSFSRTSKYMTHPVFNTHRSESQMLRYLNSLAQKDLTLCQSMISLGSCTMKLNATSELAPISWPEFTNIHPLVPQDQAAGYLEMIQGLNSWLASITGFAAVSTQPNSGATGEYAGLLAIQAYHESRGEGHRNICLIPNNAHGTNPASAVMIGMKVVGIKCTNTGEVDVEDLKEKAAKHSKNVASLMVTYPSTNGVFEEAIKDIIDIVHSHGGQVYMDGANMNAQLGMCSPGGIGADVCHLNLHKTFAIPHGGGGPGVGSIGVAEHLAPFLPGHTVVPVSGEGKNVVVKADNQIAAAPYGSGGVLPISWMYIRMMGGKGLLASSQVAILNANYMAKRLEGHYKILFKGARGMNAHEFIVDLRPFKQHDITEDDVAKRLADFGFHAPTMSWPVPGTIMIEPTESEDRAECDRLVDALIQIRGEIQDVVDGSVDAKDNLLKNAPHTAAMVCSDTWSHPYSREDAAFPTPWVQAHKFWPTVSRIDNVWGDRNLMCTCPPVEAFEEDD